MGDVSEHFSQWEIECKCGCGKIIINPYLVHRLELVRQSTARRMIINSWCRCTHHNEDVGGFKGSAHIWGEAVDVAYNNAKTMLRYLYFFRHHGFTRIILYPGRLHADISPEGYHPYFEIKEETYEWLKTNC